MALNKILVNDNEYNIVPTVTDETACREFRELTDYSWTELLAAAKKGSFLDIKVGDYKYLDLSNGVKVKMNVAGINTEKGLNGLGNHIDMISEESVGDYYWKVNESDINYNNGDSGSYSPWQTSNIKSFLNNTVFSRLPEELQNVLTEAGDKQAPVELRYSSSGTITSSTGLHRYSYIGKLWLPTEFEVFGDSIYGTKGWSAGTAVQYPLFEKYPEKRPKRTFLMNVADGSSYQFCVISSTGVPDIVGSNTDKHWYGYSLCFRLK